MVAQKTLNGQGLKITLHVSRGVGMASKMPSRILKKECAGILENMKVLT